MTPAIHTQLCVKCSCLEVHVADHARGIKTCRVCTPLQQRSLTLAEQLMAKMKGNNHARIYQ